MKLLFNVESFCHLMWPDLALFSANDMHIKILLEHTEAAIIKKKIQLENLQWFMGYQSIVFW